MADVTIAGIEAGVEIISDDSPIGTTDDAVPVLAEGGGADSLPHHAMLQADGSVKLPLLYPVTLRYRTGVDAPVREETTSELHFHRLNGADMRAVGAASADSRAVLVIARSARVGEALMHRLFDRMDAADVTAAGDVVAHFLGSGRRKTGL